MKVAIFGAGQAGKYLYEEIISNSNNIQVVAFIDNFVEGIYKNCIIYKPRDFFHSYIDIDAIFIAAGAQKTLRAMINLCRKNSIDEIYMLHDIAGKCHLQLFEDGKMNTFRIRKLNFSKEKPSLHYFEVPITDNCNLNCKGCLFASNTTKTEQHIPYEILEVDAKRILGVMSLGVKCGQEITVTLDGEQEEEAADKLKAFLEANL